MTTRITGVSTSYSSVHLPWPAFGFFCVTVVIGGNGEQLVDGLMNIDMDSAVSGGKVAAASAKVSQFVDVLLLA